jgi:hypothetical protein
VNDTSGWWASDAIDAERWRPVTEPVVERVRSALDADRFPHALMIIGPEGLGREAVAVEIAAMLVCGSGGDPGCRCAACDRVRRGSHPDVTALLRRRDPSSGKLKKHVDVDQIREVVASAPSRPYEGRSRVWVLSDAERGSIGDEAANAFLKILEEPPGHVRFLLLASNPDLVLPTIRSRCQALYLPGAVAQGARTGEGGVPTELGGSGLGREMVAEAFALADATLRSGLRGEVLPLLCLPARLDALVAADGDAGLDGSERRELVARLLDVVAAAAVELSVGPESDASEASCRLAADLLVVGRRIRELNLDPERQLVALLLDWRRAACRI